MDSVHVASISFDRYFFDPLVRRISETTAESGHEVDVICLRQKHEKKYEVYNGVHIHRVPMDRGYGRPLPSTVLSWCWFMLLAAFTITRLHIKHAYDVIHVHNMPDFLVFATIIPKLLGAKVILEVQDVSPELMAVKAKGRLRPVVTWLATLQERISTMYADHVITVCWTFEELLRKRGVPARKLTVILNSANPTFFPLTRRPALPSEADKAEGRPFIIMYHGTVAERAGMDTALRALALARQKVSQLRLDIKGRGEQIPILKELAVELGVNEHVIFSESCQAHEVVDFVVSGDVGIIPYRNDGFQELLLPTKAYEFAWMHRPMIASNTKGIRSMFRPESIVLCDPDKPESFAEAIIDLYEHPEKRARMIASAAEDYEAYRWEIMSKRYCQLLASLSRKSNPSYT